MVALSGLLIWQVSPLLRAFEWEGHTDAVIAQANLSQKLLLDMETGKRGYLLSGAPNFLQPYREADSRTGPALDKLGSLVADNQPQENRALSIRTLSSQWNADAQATITDAGVITPATQRRFSDDRGKHLMDAMRGQFDGLSTAVRKRLFTEEASGKNVCPYPYPRTRLKYMLRPVYIFLSFFGSGINLFRHHARSLVRGRSFQGLFQLAFQGRQDLVRVNGFCQRFGL